MSPNEQLQFRGESREECERFITAVDEHARVQGKLGDDQWIAELVAVSLTEDALIWWSLLDEETQRSWRHLKSAMISAFRPLFHGKTRAEAEDFVRQINQRALDMGKMNDPQWTAEFASGCFIGAALRWYASLDPGVRDNWDSLQQAIATHYGQGFKDDSTAQTVTTAFLAATSPVLTKRRQRGRMRAFRKDDPAIYYLSKITNTEGRITVTSAKVAALEVEYEPASADNAIQALTIPGDQIEGFNLLGMKWYKANAGGDNYLVLCGVNLGSGTSSLNVVFRGPLVPMAWKISSSASERGANLKSIFGTDGSGQPLCTLSAAHSPMQVWLRHTKAIHEIDVELLFEPV